MENLELELNKRIVCISYRHILSSVFKSNSMQSGKYTRDIHVNANNYGNIFAAGGFLPYPH